MNRAIAVLVGNGLSVAQAPGLTLRALTTEIANRINLHARDGAGDPSRILQELAAFDRSGDPEEDFESLLGPLDAMSENLTILARLSEVMAQAPTEIVEAVAATRVFASAVRRIGVSHVLDVISERSRAPSDARDVIRGFVDDVLGAAGGGKTTFANLNYDTYLHAVLSEDGYSHRLSDMCRGDLAESCELAPGLNLMGFPLRKTHDFPSGRELRLIHLHGELTWLREPGGGGVFRFSIQELRNRRVFEKIRDGRVLWTPEVVLTNQARKSRLVLEYPFAFAYEAFHERLMVCDRWLVAGYSFKDQCVNDLMANALAQRSDHMPQVLVVTKGRGVDEEVVLEALSQPTRHSVSTRSQAGRTIVRSVPGQPWLSVVTAGVAAMSSDPQWIEWAESSEQ